MFRLAVVLAIAAVALAAPKDPLDDRVIGGQTAAQGQFPYQISMRLTQGNTHHCGGTIISPRFIITAAHCVYQRYVGEFYIVVGTNTLSSGGDAYGLENVVYHGAYNPQDISNDIAILKTSSDIQYSALVQPLPMQQGDIPAGSNLVLSGWGLTSWPANQPPNSLQFINLRSIDINQCAQALAPGNIFLNQICTFTAEGQGACAGDSGGPLVHNGVLTGIVSWGRPCAVGYPDVFTKVASFVPWIQQTLPTM